MSKRASALIIDGHRQASQAARSLSILCEYQHCHWAVVLTDDQAKPFWTARLCSRAWPGRIDATWTPGAATIDRLETALVGAVQAALDETARPTGCKAAATDYYRPYAGYVVQGQRFVYINGFHGRVPKVSAPPEWWRTRASLLCDGGTLFFGASFDVQTGGIASLPVEQVNVEVSARRENARRQRWALRRRNALGPMHHTHHDEWTMAQPDGLPDDGAIGVEAVLPERLADDHCGHPRHIVRKAQRASAHRVVGLLTVSGA